ncbi:hypothetical protein [Mesorhizobium cantuariense]|uniref:Peptidase S54 rhomboid domain-containing protein n=1 Tax=Mesorhizobium cantuariense TaxID=1300275 RepID=A0ABV7MNZ9_9HYPH
MQIGQLAVHWHGVGNVVGILFAWWYAKCLVVDVPYGLGRVLPMKREGLDDFILWAPVGVLWAPVGSCWAGARSGDSASEWHGTGFRTAS